MVTYLNNSDITKRQPNETTLQYYARLKKAVDDGLIELSIQDMYQLIYGEYKGYDYSQRCLKFLKDTLELDEKFDIDGIFDTVKSDMHFCSNKLEIHKEKYQIQDYKTHINQQVRNLSRFDSLKNIAVDMAHEFNKSLPILNCKYNRQYNTNKSGILVLSDWHMGLEIDNYLNIYNYDVFKDRIKQIVEKVIENIKLHNLEKLYVINLNDLISGIIHNIIRLQNRENIVQQIMIVSETLAEMMVELSQYVEIEYHSTLDNHSRVIADKKQSIDKENFCLLIDWFLKERLKDTDIKICSNEFDEEICTFHVYNWNYLGVHGEKDRVSNVVQNLSLMTKRFYNAVFTAHYHHSSSDEIHSTYVFANGCLSGVDVHSKDLRKTSNPSQTLYIVSEDDCLKDVCILKLK